MGLEMLLVGSGAFAAMFVFHWLRLQYRAVTSKEMPILTRYILGVIGIALPFFAWAAMNQQAEAALTLAVAITGAGIGTAAIFGTEHVVAWVRGLIHQKHRAETDAKLTKDREAYLMKEREETYEPGERT